MRTARQATRGLRGQELLIGRQVELESLQRVSLGRARADHAVVVGEAGIGKTALLDEFTRQAEVDGIRVLRGYCYPGEDAAGAFLPFWQIVEQLSATAGLDLLRHAGNTPLALHRDASGDRARLLRELARLVLDETASTRSIICVEDIHWADTSSLLLLNNLVDTSQGAHVIVSMRDEPATVEARQLIGRIKRKAKSIALAGLKPRAMGELVESLCGRGYLSKAELRELHLYTGGNPFFVRELVSHLEERGFLRRHSVVEATRRAETPASLSEVLDLRLQSLPVETINVLTYCATFGLEFRATLLANAAGMSEESVLDHLQIATMSSIVRQREIEWDELYEFAHPLFAKRLYEGMKPSERRQRHARIAEAIEAEPAAASVYDRARHFALGFGRKKTAASLERCRLAAEDAEGLLAYETAAQYWEYGLRLVPTRSKATRADLLFRLGWSLWAAGKWTVAADVWQEASGLFESLGDAGRVGEIALSLGDMYRWRQQLPESEHWLRCALEVLPRPSVDAARALALLGSIRCVEDRPDEGLPQLEEALAMVQDTQVDPMILYWLNYGFLTAGDPERSFRLAERGLQIAVEQSSARGICLLGGSLVHHELSRLNLTGARKASALINDHADDSDSTSLVISFLCRALTLAYSGRWRRLLTLSEKWMSAVRLAGPYQVATARIFWAEAMLGLGYSGEAIAAIKRAIPDLERMAPLAGLHLARAFIRAGKPSEAESVVEQVPDTMLGATRFGAGRAVFGDVVADLDRPDLWHVGYEALSGETRAVVVVYGPVSIERVRGRLATQLERWSDAIGHFSMAVEQLRNGQASWELAETYLNFASMRRQRSRRGDREKAEFCDAKAMEITSGLNVPPSMRINGARPTRNPHGLSTREMEVLDLVSKGMRNHEIAGHLQLSEKTVGRHLENIFNKMGVSGRTEAVVQAVKSGMIGWTAPQADAIADTNWH